jgi:hypothetical protein
MPPSTPAPINPHSHAVLLCPNPLILHLINPTLAYEHASQAYNAAYECFAVRDEDTSWVIPLFVRASNDLRVVAYKVRLCTTVTLCTLPTLPTAYSVYEVLV